MRIMIVLLLILSTSTYAQKFTFKKSPMGVVNTSLLASDGKIYIGTLNGGVYVSTDTGKSWSRVSLATLGQLNVRALAQMPDGTILAGTDQGGVKILTPQNTWRTYSKGLPIGTLNVPPSIRSITIDSSGRIIIAARAVEGQIGGVFMASDTMSGWTPLNAGLETDKISSLITTRNGSVYCGTDGSGVYRLVGSQWNTAGGEIGNSHIHSLASYDMGSIIAGTDKGLCVLPEGASAWINTPSVTEMPVLSICIDESAQRIYLGLGHTDHQAGPLYGMVMLTTDLGTTLRDITPNSTGLRFSSILVNQNGMVFAFGQGIHRSATAGSTWQTVNSGFRDQLPARFTSGFIVTNEGHFIQGTELGLWKSTDRGETWHQSNNGIRHPIISMVYAEPNGYLFAGAYAYPRYTSSLNRLYRSTDNGESWDTVDVCYDGVYTCMTTSEDGTLFLGHGFGAQPPSPIVGSGCARSTDRGATWTDLPCIGGKAFSVGVTKSGTILWGGETLGLYRSTDYGDTWDTTIHIGIGGNMAPVAVAPDGTIFTCTYGERHIWFSDSLSDGRAYTNMTHPSYPAYTSPVSFLWDRKGRMYLGGRTVPPSSALYTQILRGRKILFLHRSILSMEMLPICSGTVRDICGSTARGRCGAVIRS